MANWAIAYFKRMHPGKILEIDSRPVRNACTHEQTDNAKT